jgi:hypothetical protein
VWHSSKAAQVTLAEALHRASKALGALTEGRVRLQKQKEPEMLTRSVSASPVTMEPYRGKPLPAIIGVELWKNGLVREW